MSDIIHVQVAKVCQNPRSQWLLVPGTVAAGSWPAAVMVCALITLIPVTSFVCL